MTERNFCPNIPSDISLYKFFHTVRVRYADTDAQQFVYYGAFFNFFEGARQEYWRRLGIKLDELMKSGFIIAVVDTSCRFHNAAGYDDILDVHVRTSDIRDRSFDIDFLVARRSDNMLIATARTSFVFINANDRKPCAIPNWISTSVRQFEESN